MNEITAITGRYIWPYTGTLSRHYFSSVMAKELRLRRHSLTRKLSRHFFLSLHPLDIREERNRFVAQ